MKTKKIKRAIQVKIPTNDLQVKFRLRVLEKPICIFGENIAVRRDRLKEFMTNLVELGKKIPEFKNGSEKDLKKVDLNLKKKSFWIEGEKKSMKKRKHVRIRLLYDSLENAKRRLKIERERRKVQKFIINREIKLLEENLKTVVAQLSIPADNRPLTVIKFNFNGSRLATGARTGYCRLWDVTGECTSTIKAHTERLSDLIWNPKDNSEGANFITTGCDMYIRMWNKDGLKISSFPIEHTNRISKMVWHPYQDIFFSTSFDKTWCMWDLETNQTILKQPGHENAVYGVAIHPDGGLLATSDLSGNIRLWDIRKGQHVWGINKHVKQVLSLDFSPKGYLFASGADDNSIRIWDLRKKSTFYSMAAHTKPITSLKFAPGHGNFMMSTSRDCTVKFWNGKQFSLIRTVQAHEEAISSGDISPAANLMATASFDRTFKIWGAEHLNSEKI